MSTGINFEEELKEKREFAAITSGSVFKLPSYRVKKDVGLVRTGRDIDLPIVRGTRVNEEGQEVFSIEGTTHETLLSVMMQDLEEKNNIVKSSATEKAIEKMNEALVLLENRQRSRYIQGKLTKQEE